MIRVTRSPCNILHICTALDLGWENWHQVNGKHLQFRLQNCQSKDCPANTSILTAQGTQYISTKLIFRHYHAVVRNWQWSRERNQDGRGGYGAHLPHIQIKNASMCWTVLKENQLEPGKRSPIYPSCKEDLHVTIVGWEKNHQDGTGGPGRVSVRKRRSTGVDPHSGSSLDCWEICWVRQKGWRSLDYCGEVPQCWLSNSVERNMR